jgi:hypothetical protein
VQRAVQVEVKLLQCPIHGGRGRESESEAKGEQELRKLTERARGGAKCQFAFSILADRYHLRHYLGQRLQKGVYARECFFFTFAPAPSTHVNVPIYVLDRSLSLSLSLPIKRAYLYFPLPLHFSIYLGVDDFTEL